MLQLVFNPGDDAEKRITFTVSESDIDDAVDFGRARTADPLDLQISDAAYHKVMDQRVCRDERIFELPWVILRDGRIIARNHMAMGVTEADLH